jgi:membrane dipeptidase
MISRRQFAKTLGGAVTLTAIKPDAEPPKQPMLKDFLQHLDHAVKVCGQDHVGIGTDIPFLHVGEEELAELKRRTEERKAAGIAAPGEDRPAYIPDLNTERKLELVTDALLKRGYKSSAVEKILGGNFKRVLADIWST